MDYLEVVQSHAISKVPGTYGINQSKNLAAPPSDLAEILAGDPIAHAQIAALIRQLRADKNGYPDYDVGSTK